ncbi:hypothetical protein [Muricauda sp. MAR_2010_75]|uniref:hypothetical protein n=1 Tax=Allomuricauda sp. MAR_2010_75 TaxID=1250232 RepID=UPI000561A446|nr:hypothetical protein [Muricauda sp. MAR_2010_75]
MADSEEVLIMARKLAILREENTNLKKILEQSKEAESKARELGNVVYKAFKQLKYLCGHRNPKIAIRCLSILNEYHKRREILGLKPLPHLYYTPSDEQENELKKLNQQ